MANKKCKYDYEKIKNGGCAKFNSEQEAIKAFVAMTRHACRHNKQYVFARSGRKIQKNIKLKNTEMNIIVTSDSISGKSVRYDAKFIDKIIRKTFSIISLDDIDMSACIACDIDISELKSKSRKQEIITARGIVCAFLYKNTSIENSNGSNIARRYNISKETVTQSARSFKHLLSLDDELARKTYSRFQFELLKLIRNKSLST